MTKLLNTLRDHSERTDNCVQLKKDLETFLYQLYEYTTVS